MTDIHSELTGKLIVDNPYQRFEVVLTDKNELMILHHVSLGYNGIILNTDDISALDRLISEVYRRRMNKCTTMKH